MKQVAQLAAGLQYCMHTGETITHPTSCENTLIGPDTPPPNTILAACLYGHMHMQYHCPLQSCPCNSPPTHLLDAAVLLATNNLHHLPFLLLRFTLRTR